MSSTLKLLGSIIIDLAGMGFSLIPFLGGLSDLIIAPLTAIYIKLAYDLDFMAVLGFAEEILFLDFIPSATIAWVISRIG